MTVFNIVRRFILGLLVLYSSVVNAEVIQFGNSTENPLLFNIRNFDNAVNDIDLTITTGVFSNNSGLITIADSGSNNNRSSFEFSDGLGVIGGKDDNNEIDGEGQNDIVIFSFSEQVSFLGLEFGNVDRQDDFHFGLVDEDTFLRTLTDTRISSNNFILSTGLVGTTFAVGAVERNDSFTLNSISITPVPEPSTITVFILGFICILRLRRA